ncbi:MAG: COX15/CtaA family protein [Planctomycetota bacterium]
MSSFASTRIVHRLAWLLLALVWPLIWIGGLVTTYDAGMSVPDWPNTYGYNLLLYPMSSWLSGPFDIFVEHGHRLLAMVVGFVSIGLLIAAWTRENRFWVVVLCFGVLLAVIGQGGLGGLRVVLSDQNLAMVHGCVGPAFFALCVIAMVVTSRWWMEPEHFEEQQTVATRPSEPAEEQPGTPTTRVVRPTRVRGPRELGALVSWMAGFLVVLSFAQLVMGAMLRHASPTTRPSWFAMIVASHILVAFLLWLATVLVWWRIRRCGDLTLSRPSGALVPLVGLQICLGLGTWIVNYGYATFLKWMPGSAGYLVQAKGFVESFIVTGHVATGSLILAAATFLLVRVLRSRYRQRYRQSESTRAASQPVGDRDDASGNEEVATAMV